MPDDLRERIARAIEERMRSTQEAARLFRGDDDRPPIDPGCLNVLNGMISGYSEAARIARETPDAAGELAAPEVTDGR